MAEFLLVECLENGAAAGSIGGVLLVDHVVFADKCCEEDLDDIVGIVKFELLPLRRLDPL